MIIRMGLSGGVLTLEVTSLERDRLMAAWNHYLRHPSDDKDFLLAYVDYGISRSMALSLDHIEYVVVP